MKAKVYLFITDWATEYDGSDMRVEVCATKKKAQELIREEYNRYKKEYISRYGRENIECSYSKDYAFLQVEGRYNEKHDRWSIQEKEILLTKDNIIEL